MDIKPQSTTQPISDDQELAKVLAGVNAEAEGISSLPPVDEGAIAKSAVGEIDPVEAAVSAATEAVALESVQQPETVAKANPQPIQVDGELDGVKKQAITELRPLVDKLELPPEEKFDTYLLLIRSTDDKTLIAPAHEAAKQISDETRKAQALLDVIKEIDFLSGQA